MTGLDQIADLLERLVVIASAMDNRLARIEREVCNPLYQVDVDGVITRVKDNAVVIPINGKIS